jgi:acyl-CoA oxidase
MNEPIPMFKLRFEVINLVDPGFYTRVGVHYGLFVSNLQSQCTSSQFTYWIEQGALNMQGMFGCFAMTELGHGSNVQGVETTATLDLDTDEFVIHTPTLTATKWWIGGAAHTATHAVVFAQLIVKGKNHGVKSFVVPLRDPKDFSLKIGVTIGDCGKKMGRDGIDNGYIQFSHVRIPRSYLLMKYTKVDSEGNVTKPPLDQVGYGALMNGRVSMVRDGAIFAFKALTIALRYAAVRRQFSSSPGQPETKLLDYPIHQHRLIPLLAKAFALRFTANEVKAIYENLLEVIDQAKSPESLKAAMNVMKEAHATSAGLKAFSTWECLDIIERCRQACGGHGYSSYTGLANMYQDFAVQCTWEGDNTILTLQLGRYLIQSYLNRNKGDLPPGIQYLNLLSSPEKMKSTCKSNSVDDLINLNTLVQAWDLACASCARDAGEAYQNAVKQGQTPEQAFEFASIERLRAAKIHTNGYTIKQFAQSLQNAPKSLQPILTRLAQLHAVNTTVEFSGELLQVGYFNPEQMSIIRDQVKTLCTEIRKDVIPLVDSFGFSDYVVNSPLGRYDGDVYTAYFDLVQRNNPPVHPPPYFESLIKPLLQSKSEDNAVINLEID